jgi:hypothetical protein
MQDLWIDDTETFSKQGLFWDPRSFDVEIQFSATGTIPCSFLCSVDGAPYLLSDLATQ